MPRIPAIYVNRAGTEEERRASLYGGDVHVVTHLMAVRALAEWADELIRDAFEGLDPETAQHELEVHDFIRRVSPLKSRFTNHQRTKELSSQLLLEIGCDADDTYFDLPRMRVAPSSGYLTSGVSYAYRPHRDSWYAQPRMSINLWTPIRHVERDNVMSFWPSHWGDAMQHTGFDYDKWVAESRFAAETQVNQEDRPHPVPLKDPDGARELRIVANPGDLTMFSALQLHGTAPNTSGRTRFSYDLRYVNVRDLQAGIGPDDPDAGVRGSTLRDYLRVADLAPIDLDALAVATPVG